MILYENTLAFCIPTFNRALLLDEVLTNLIAVIRPFALWIIISDNNSTDETQSIIKIKQLEYDKIIYYKQAKNVEFDRNIETVLALKKVEYYWLLGDTTSIKENTLAQVLKMLQTLQPDVFVNNVAQRVKGIDSKLYESPVKVLEEIGWHMTQLPSLIISKNVAVQNCHERYYDTLFMHWGLIFEYLGTHSSTKVYWCNENLLESTKQTRQEGWYPSKAWMIFMQKWSEIVFSLPSSYPISSKLKCIYAHSAHTNIFSFKGTAFLRLNRAYSFSVFYSYRKYIKYAGTLPTSFYFIFSIFPISLLKTFHLISITFKKQLKFANMISLASYKLIQYTFLKSHSRKL